MLPNNNDFAGANNQGRIVFSGMINSTTHQIYVINADSTKLLNLTSSGDLWHFDPVASPDGIRVAYETWDNFPNASNGNKIKQHLYAVNLDGTGRIKLTTANIDNIDNIDNKATSSTFSWSPDGKKIAYESSGDIYAVNADGTSSQRQTYDGKAVGEGMRVGNHNPSWSSTNNVVFASVTFNGVEPVSTAFRDISTDGTGLKTLFDFDVPHIGGYVWSNDMKSIAFIGLDNSDFANLYVINTATNFTVQRLLLNASEFYSIANLSWSPDDSKISFTGIPRSQSHASSFGEIHVVNVNDGSFRKLQGSQTLNITPVWSTDGTKIAFMKTIGDEAIAINVIDVNSSEKNEVVRIKQTIVNQPMDWMSNN
jgi:Tol biopolymer transport system component